MKYLFSLFIQKNRFCFIALFFTVLVSYGQDTTFYNLKMQKVVSISDSAAYYEIVYPPAASFNVWKILYDVNGQIVKEKKGINKNDKFWEGYTKKWHPNGQLQSIVQYAKGDIDTIRTFWENGTVKRFDTYKKGKLESGICYDSIGKIIPHFPYEVMSEFSGGFDELHKFIKQNLQYPDRALNRGIAGTVLIGFCIDKDGYVSEIEVRESVHKTLDDEAVRVVKMIPAWKPGIVDGIPVRTYYTIPIVFPINDFLSSGITISHSLSSNYKPVSDKNTWIGQNNEYLIISKKKASLQKGIEYQQFDISKHLKNRYIILCKNENNIKREHKFNIVCHAKDTLILSPEGNDIFELCEANKQNQYVFANSLLTYKFERLYYETTIYYLDFKLKITLVIDSAKNSKITLKDESKSKTSVIKSTISKNNYERLLSILSSYDLSNYANKIDNNKCRNQILEIRYNGQNKTFEGCNDISLPTQYSKLPHFLTEYIAQKASIDMQSERRKNKAK